MEDIAAARKQIRTCAQAIAELRRRRRRAETAAWASAGVALAGGLGTVRPVALVPAVCRTCGTLFAASNILGGDARGISFSNVTVGPCPVCGGDGRIPDGTYDFLGDTIRVLAAPEHSRAGLERLLARATRIQQTQAPPEEIARTLGREFPELAPTVNVFIEKACRIRV